MKKLLNIAVLLLAAFILEAAEAPCVVRKVKGWTYGQDRLDMAAYIEFFNAHNRHVLSFIQWRAAGKKGPVLQCRLNIPGAYGNYSDPVSFLKLEVNGFKLQEISFSPDDIRVWNDPKTGFAGADFPLNFDGTQIILRAHIRPDSGVLFLKFRLDSRSVTPLSRGKIIITNCISGLHLAGNQAVWSLKKYDRQAVSPMRTYSQHDRQVAVLKPDDAFLMLMDSTLPGKGDMKKVRKDHGPSVFIPDPKIQTSIKFGVYTEITMALKPDFKEIIIGVWQKKEVITNDYLTQFIKENPGQFRP